MDFITLNNGVKMPLLGLGLYLLHGRECEKCILEAIDIGYRLFDTAQMYGNEKELGNVVKQCGIPREELFLTTKIYRPNTDYASTKKAIEQSLRALQTDYIDLLLIHEPYHTANDMYKAMEEAYKEQKIKAIGISNFNSSKYINFIHNCNVIPAVNQVEAHVFFQQEELCQTIKQYGTHMEAWSPFATGKKQLFTNSVLKKIGEKYNKTPAQIALKFLIQRGITVIPKTSHEYRMKENINIFNFYLSEQDMEQIKKLDERKTLFGWY